MSRSPLLRRLYCAIAEALSRPQEGRLRADPRHFARGALERAPGCPDDEQVRWPPSTGDANSLTRGAAVAELLLQGLPTAPDAARLVHHPQQRQAVGRGGGPGARAVP